MRVAGASGERGGARRFASKEFLLVPGNQYQSKENGKTSKPKRMAKLARNLESREQRHIQRWLITDLIFNL
jgi:hypothetical protein